MYDIEELEKQWTKYRQRKRRPWIWGTIAAVVLALVFGSLYVKRENYFSFSALKAKKESKAVKNLNVQEISLDGPLRELETEDDSADKPTPLVEVLSEDEEHLTPLGKTQRKQLHLEVVEANNPKALKEIEKRFRLGHDVDDSLFLAKTYYAKGQYQKAEYWALQTNKIDDRVEESWLIFVKSKLKRGQRNEALRILNSYIKKSHSAEAKALLEKIQKTKR